MAYHYRLWKPPIFYKALLEYVCPQLQFNTETKQEITAYRHQHEIPDLRSNPTTTTRNSTRSGISVAFHVRRTDKITSRESRSYAGQEYVDKLVKVLDTNKLKHQVVTQCYIATDDSRVVEELTTALQNASIPCTIYSLATTTKEGRLTQRNRVSREQTIRLMTDLDILSETTYFIGTFNSNLGGLVGVLRGCRQYYYHYEEDSTLAHRATLPNSQQHKEEEEHTIPVPPPPHFANSYGVDKDGWSFRWT